MKKSNLSTLTYVLESLLPFTEANTKLVFRPSSFFNELDRRSRVSRPTLQSAYYRAKAHGLITFEAAHVTLSAQAQRILAQHSTDPLPQGQYLMVSFDIPEDIAHKRRQLRSLLKELKFVQKQRSVWISDQDHRAIILSLISELSLSPHAKVFLATSLN